MDTLPGRSGLARQLLTMAVDAEIARFGGIFRTGQYSLWADLELFVGTRYTKLVAYGPIG